MSKILIREMAREDLGLVRDLYLKIKNRLRSETYDKWSFFATPWGDSSSVVAMDGNVCAGLIVMRPSMLDLAGELVLGAQMTDILVLPEYRKVGLFAQLAEDSLKVSFEHGIEVIYGFPNSNSYPGLVRRLNYDHVGDVVEYCRPVRRINMSLLLKKWTNDDYVVEKSDFDGTTPPEIEPLIYSIGGKRHVSRINRDPIWLAWRYAKASGAACSWFIARDRMGKVQGVILAGEKDDSWGGIGKGELRIQEMFATSESALEVLFDWLETWAREKGMNVIKALVKDEGLEKLLRKARFSPSLNHPFIVRKLTARTMTSNVHSFSSWRIMGGDVDTY